MSSTKGQGQSDATALKQSRFTDLLETWLPMTREIQKKHAWASKQFLYVDMNAGCGFNHEVGVEGSPLIFARAAKRHGLKVKAYLLEINPAAAAELRERIAPFQSPDASYEVIEGDMFSTIPTLRRRLGNSAKSMYGLVYSDPNGADVPLLLYEDLAHFWPLVDLAFNGSMTSAKRCLLARTSGKSPHPPSAEKGFRLNEAVTHIDKKHIALTRTYGPWQWTMGILTNAKPRKWPDQFYDVKSAEGFDALNKASLTGRELKKITPLQPELGF